MPPSPESLGEGLGLGISSFYSRIVNLQFIVIITDKKELLFTTALFDISFVFAPFYIHRRIYNRGMMSRDAA